MSTPRNPAAASGIRRELLLGMGIAAAAISGAKAQADRAIRAPAAVFPLSEAEPPARIAVDPPDVAWLAEGRVVIQCPTENFRVVQVVGPAALAVSPRIGHVYVTVAEGPWRWADASGEAIIIDKLAPGPHRVLINLVNANQQTLDQGVVRVVIP